MSNDSNKEVDEIDEARDPHAVKMFKRANKEKREHGKDLDSIAKSGGPNMFVKRGAAEDAQDAAKKRAASGSRKQDTLRKKTTWTTLTNLIHQQVMAQRFLTQ